jgi:hypothetical protein
VNSTAFRALWVVLGALSAALAIFLPEAAGAGMGAMGVLLLKALAAALAFVLAAPTILARSTLEPGKTEERVVREALSGQPPRGFA